MKIVVAEDTAVTRRLLHSVLVETGHEVIAVDDGATAWDAWQRERPELLVLDWLMPELDGVELTRRVRSTTPGRDTFVLMVTVRAEADDLAVALAAGVDDYIVKPVTPEQVRARVTIAQRRIEDRMARRDAERALARARWLAGIGETTLAMQHELNTPLTTLLAEIALARGPLSDTQRTAALDSAELQASRIAQVLRHLSTLDAPQTVEVLPGVRMLDLSDGPAGE